MDTPTTCSSSGVAVIFHTWVVTVSAFVYVDGITRMGATPCEMANVILIRVLKILAQHRIRETKDCEVNLTQIEAHNRVCVTSPYCRQMVKALDGLRCASSLVIGTLDCIMLPYAQSAEI